MQLLVDTFLLTGKPQHGRMQYALKRYRSLRADMPRESHPSSGVALLFLHCINTHKETWEPVIEKLFELQDNASGPHRVNLIEAWSMDSPNHGLAAVLNEKIFVKHPKLLDAFSCAEGLKQVLDSGLISGDRVVGIGHSAGSTCTVLSADGYPLDRLPYSSMILVEPPMMTRPILDKMLSSSGSELSLVQIVAQSVLTKKDIWSSREEALQWLAKRYPWKKWDPRVLKLFSDYGLRDLPTGTYPDKQTGVTLACTRAQEAIAYIDHKGALKSLDVLSALCTVLPVHCIIGGRPDFVSDETREGIWDESQGRRMASVTEIENAGHLVAQESPDGTAGAIWKILEQSSFTKRESRL